MDLAEQLRQVTERLRVLDAENERLRRTMADVRCADAEPFARVSLFDTFLRHTPAAVAMFDTAMRFLAVSDRWIADYHVADIELCGRSFYDVCPNIPEHWPTLLHRALTGETVRQEADVYAHADGSVAWIKWELVPWYDAESTIGGVIMFSEVVTDAKLAIDFLTSRHAFLRQIIDTMPNLITLTDADDRVVLANTRATEFFATSFEEMAGHTLQDIPGVRDGWVRREHAEVLEHADAAHVLEEQYLNVRSGMRCWFHTVQVPLTTPGGEEQRLSVSTDVTAEKLTAEALARNEERYRSLVENVSDMVWEVDQNYRFTFVNQRSRELLGYAPNELIGMSPFDLIPAHEAAIPYAKIDAFAQRGEAFPIIEHAMLRKDGASITIEVSGSPLTDDAGTFLGYRGVMRDITDKEIIERALRASEERYRRIVETAGEGIWLVDAEGLTQYVNQQLADMLGVPRAEMAQRPVKEFFTSDDVAMMQSLISADCTDARQQVEVCLTRPSGRDLWVIIAVTRLRDAQGQCVGLMAMMTDITDRKQVEIALSESEEKFRILTEQTAAVVGIIQGRHFVYINPYMETLSGYTREELLSHDFLEFVAPESRKLINLRALDRLRGASNLPSHYEFPMITRDGEIRWIDLSVSISHYQGRPAILGVGFDITNRKHAEEALRESETKFRALADNASVAVAIMQHDQFVYLNPRMETLSGYTNEELMRMNYTQLLTPEFKLLVSDRARRRLEGETVPTRYEMQFRTKSDELRWAEVSAARMELCGEPAIIAIFNDVTDRKRGREALERERAFLSSALEVLPFPIFFIDPEERIIRMNQAVVSFSPVAVERWQDVDLLTPDTHTVIPHHEWPASKALRGDTIRNFEAILRSPDGAECSMLLHTAPIISGSEIIAAVVAAQDINALKEADRAKDEFLAVLSHELLTPLTSIIGWTQVVRERPSVLGQTLDIIERNARRQHHILEDMLDMSRIIHGKLSIKPEAIDLWALVCQVLEDLEQQFDKAELHLEVHETTQTFPLYADPDRLRQAMLNILNNAIKFTDKGGTVTVSLTRSDAQAQLRISDTGRGISPDHLEELFHPFRQVQHEIGTGGLGLGLALVRGIVEAHDGEVYADSAGIGQGSSFTITLPLAEPMAKAA